MRPKSSKNIGPTFHDFATSGALALEHYHALTLSRAGYRANPTASQVSASELPTSAIFGLTSTASFATYDPATQWLKTSQGYAQAMMDGISGESYPTWPQQGMVSNGLVFQLQPLALGTSENVYGLLPTPTVNMVSGGANHNSPSVLAGSHGLNLAGAVARSFLPTPNAILGTYDLNWQATDNRKKPNKLGWAVREATEDLTSGQLNPQWVEWLMGFPIDHTAYDA
jgi:hypothetical protein